MSRHNYKKALILASLFASSQAHATFEIMHDEVDGKDTAVYIGGYAKLDIRHVDGDVAYQDYWVGNFPGGEPVETSRTGFNVKESRLLFKVNHGEISAVVEVDMYGGGGNEVVSNSSNLRLRHYYINYKNWMVGQNWSTFMPLHALPESLDFGGPHVGEVFARQVQVRYTYGNWQFAIENPETNGDGDIDAPSSAVGLTGKNADPDESTPDLVARYNWNEDWGTLSVGVLARKLDQGGIDEFAFATNIAGKIKTFDRDDLRFQITAGDPGRYAAAGMTPDVVVRPNTEDELEVETTLAYTLAYRHFWDETLRSTVYYGAAKTDVLERDRAHWAVNLLTDIEKNFTVGVEFGNYSVNDEGAEDVDSNYLQFSAVYKF